MEQTACVGSGAERAHQNASPPSPACALHAEGSPLSTADSLLAGIPQRVRFTVTTGHYTVKNGDSLQVSNTEAMLILCPADSRAVVYSNARGEGLTPCPPLPLPRDRSLSPRHALPTRLVAAFSPAGACGDSGLSPREGF